MRHKQKLAAWAQVPLRRTGTWHACTAMPAPTKLEHCASLRANRDRLTIKFERRFEIAETNDNLKGDLTNDNLNGDSRSL